MFNFNVNNRYQASLAHLLLSILVAGSILLCAYFIWYQEPIIHATGALKIFLLVLLVDAGLGPLLTLVVFNPQKAELKRDLAIIFLIQLAALAYGSYTLVGARPAYITFSVDRFELVQANELSHENLAAANIEEYKSIPWLRPKWVAAPLPDDIDERNDLIFSSAAGGDDIAQLPRYYQHYERSINQILERLQPLETLKQTNPTRHDQVARLIDKYSGNNSSVGFIPFAARTEDITAIIDKNSGKPVELVRLSPW